MIDVSTWTVRGTQPLDQAWYGLAWHPTQPRLYLAGGQQGAVQEIGTAGAPDGALNKLRTLALPPSPQSFTGGLAVSPDGRTLYVTNLFLHDADIAGHRDRPGDRDSPVASRTVHGCRFG